jgi:hypothetical protein
MLSVAFSYSYADCSYAECCYSGCCYAECNGALTIFFLFHLQILDELENYSSDTNTLAYISNLHFSLFCPKIFFSNYSVSHLPK